MEPKFSFRLSPPDADRLRPQVRRALEKRTELLSRQRYSRLWALTDRLSRTERVSADACQRRRKLRLVLGLVDGALGLFLLLPGLMNPGALQVPLLVGTVCFGVSVGILWRAARRLLGVLSAALSLLLLLCALGNWTGCGRFLLPAVLCGAVGAAALTPWKRRNAFDRAAQQLLETAVPAEQTTVSFSPAGMVISREGSVQEPQVVPYGDFELVLETKDLLLPVFQNAVTILQKKDLQAGSVPELLEFLSEQAQCAAVRVRPKKRADTAHGPGSGPGRGPSSPKKGGL